MYVQCSTVGMYSRWVGRLIFCHALQILDYPGSRSGVEGRGGNDLATCMTTGT